MGTASQIKRVGFTYYPRRIKSRLVRALHRVRLVASIRRSDVFVVTYPRSGTTWLAFLIASAIRRTTHEQLHLRNFVHYVPDINPVYFVDGSLKQYALLPDPRFFVVHCTYDSWLPRVIYVLRDPRDVMVSYWHYRRLTDASFQLSMKEFFLSDRHWPCRWDEHVANWLLNHQHPQLLIVHYEEMQRDTAAVLERVLNFAGARYNTPDIQRAICDSGLETMQSLEKQFGFAEAEAQQGEQFIRRGQIGGWKGELDEESLRILEQKYSSVMREVGYEPITTGF